MKKLFTMIAVVAFLAACGGNASKKAKAVEEQVVETEVVDEGCNGEGEEAAAEVEEEVVAEGAAE